MAWLQQQPTRERPDTFTQTALGISSRPLHGRGEPYITVRASFKISLSSVSSDTAFFSRAFSRSSSFRRFAGSSFGPPYSFESMEIATSDS